jgi:hypothetical protein
MAAAAAKNIAKRSASYAQAKPRLNKETKAIVVSSRTLASNPCPPLCLGLRLASAECSARSNMRAYQLPQANGIDALGKVDLPTANQSDR